MKKKIMSGIFALLMVCTMMLIPSNVTTASAASDDQPTARYTDWAFNDDFTKITIDGKTYDNYVFTIKVGDKIVIKNAWSRFLYCSNYNATSDETPEEFYNDIMPYMVNEITETIRSLFPFEELLEINHKPWQEYINSSDENLKSMWYSPELLAYKITENSLEHEDMIKFLEDESNNGYAKLVYKDNIPIAEAKQNHSVKSLSLTEDPFAYKMQQFKSYKEFKPYEKNIKLINTWAFNDDYTKVTVNGKTYDNYVVIDRCGQELVMMNMWGMYLTNPYAQINQTPDEYAAGLDDQIVAIFDASESKYPLNETISINYIPWQDTKFKDDNLQEFDTFYDSQFANVISKTDLWNMLEDKSYNGLAYGVITEKLTKEQAAKKYNPSNMKITVNEEEMIKTGEEFLAKNGGQAFLSTRLEYPTQADLKEAMKKDAPIEPKTTVVLHLNDQTMSVTNGPETKLVILEAAPVAPNGTTLVPVRAVSEAFGAKVDWLEETKEVLITKATTTIKLKLGSDISIVNGNEVKMLEAAQTINGRTVIPLRFVTENMDYKVDWDGNTKKITITE